MWSGLLWVLQGISPYNKSVEKSFNENGVDSSLMIWFYLFCGRRLSYLSWVQSKKQRHDFGRPFIIVLKNWIFPVFASELKFWDSERPIKGEFTLGMLFFRAFLIESPSIQLRLSLKKDRFHFTSFLSYYRSM